MKQNKLIILSIFIFTIVSSCFNQQSSISDHTGKSVMQEQQEFFKTVDEMGLLGERIDLWRNKRLWHVSNADFLLAGFINRPGQHAWQGEHVGKWLHAAVLAYEVTKDIKLKEEMDGIVNQLLATQLSNGYMGTYIENERFNIATTDPKGWDTWTHRYNLYGLLTYEKYHPDQRIIDACKKMGDLLIQVFGPGKADLTKYGTRQGISSTTLLESIVMLYQRTEDKKYLAFAEHIVQSSENNNGLRLMDAMLKNESVVKPGDGKAYQLMANLLGYLRLHESTGEDKYLKTVLNAWNQIQDKHLLVTGGPWTRKMEYNGNKECFAYMEAFEPTEIVVENCCTVTWIQLNLQLFDLTGESKYVEEAEKSLFNHFMGGQHTDGIDWCYYTKPNQVKPPYVPTMHCCASSGPRALEEFSARLVSSFENTVSINHLSASKVIIPPSFGNGHLTIKSEFPGNAPVEILFELANSKNFNLEYRIPYGSVLKSVSINGKMISTKINDRGYYQISREWKNKDRIIIDVSYVLQMHVQQGEKDQQWIAFTYGPVSLAQRIEKMPTEEPFKNLSADADPKNILNMLVKSSGKELQTTFKIKNTDIELIPYYQAGSRSSGPRTYFEFAR